MEESNAESLLIPSRIALNENSYQLHLNAPYLNQPQELNIVSTTKYKWHSFFPKMLMEQFARMANVYFLLIAILQSIQQISFTKGNPLILLPLVIVILINGIKDLFEDAKRKHSDNDENNSKCLVYDINTHHFIIKKWSDIVSGDIVKVNNGESIPADLILLNSSESSGICYVETKNIDGETSLKYRQANTKIKDLCQTEEKLAYFNFLCLTKQPNVYIYDFDATLYETNHGAIISYDNYILVDRNSFLLRGCSLQQTEFIYGAVIYVGHSTKSMMNSPAPRRKTSSIERVMNIQIIISFFILLLLSGLSAGMHIIVYSRDFESSLRNYLFVGSIEPDNLGELYVITTGIWILIIANFVPISLLVTMETIKFFQALVICWDIKLFDIDRKIGATVQSSTLNEELGQVKYILSDKTGTLTKNYMQFRAMSIGKEIYGDYENFNNSTGLSILPQPEMNPKNIRDSYGKITNVKFVDVNQKFETDFNNKGTEQQEYINHFMLCLCLCNTVITDIKEFKTHNILNYQASSPDEKSLIYFARTQGYIFLNRSIDNEIQIKMRDDTIITYKILHILEYSSERKRMSVIVRWPNGKIYLYSKGADSIIKQLITKNISQIQITNEHLTAFAVKGLRTLMVAFKEISEEQFNIWDKRNQEICLDVNRKENELPILYESMEKDLEICGATGIEDELQDDVENTIDSFIKIGIKVWMLTGDKMDTAKNIAYSCKLFNSQISILEIEEGCEVNDIKKKFELRLKENRSQKKQYGLIISSEELTKILNDTELVELFTMICLECISVVCSRVSPKQKAEMVSIIKTSKNSKSKIILAIGDGSNDVGMITEANIGIGIHSVEGTQAARASDYSIPQFSHLKRLLFYHGREAYRRNSYVVCYNFYKNVLFVTPHFWAGAINLFSGQNLFDFWIYQFYNPIFTALPIGWFGIMDAEYSGDFLTENGKYYLQGIYQTLFHYKRFWKWVVFGMLEGLILLLFTIFGMNSMSPYGRNQDMWSIGASIYASVVILANMNIVINTNTHSFLGSLILFLSTISFFGVVVFQSFKRNFQNLGVIHMLSTDMKSYLCSFESVGFILILTVFLSKILVYCGIVKKGHKLPPYHMIEFDKEITQQQYLGATFSQDEGEWSRKSTYIKR